MLTVWAYRRRRRHLDHDPGNVVFGSIGWLFADLMFALAMAFLVATTVGQPPRPTPLAASPSPSPSPTPTPARTPEPVLELQPVEMYIEVDWAGLLRGDATADAAITVAVKHKASLTGRHAGMVLTYGGAEGGEGRAIEIARKADDVLRALGAQGYVFRGTVFHRPFLSLHTPPQTLQIEVYLFKR